MLSREEIVGAVTGLAEDATGSITEISRLLGDIPPTTVSGWLSNQRDFPVASRGGRGKKHYSKATITKLLLFVHAARGVNGFRVNGEHAIEVLNAIDIAAAFAALQQGDAQFLALFNQPQP